MVDEKEFFAGTSDNVSYGEVENTSRDLLVQVKNLRDDAMNIYALIISDPHKHGHSIDDLRRNVVALAATLLEHGVKLEVPKKERTPEDVIKEAAGELGSIFGAKGVAAGLSFVSKVRDNITSTPEELVIYEDEAGGLYFIDEHGDEIDCDEEGNPLEEGDED